VRVKLDAIWRHGMVPILCVGEHLAEREAGTAESVVRAQLAAALGGRPGTVVAGVVVAYEPIWAIGTGVNATPADAGAMATCIRTCLGELAGAEAASTVRIQYGGSVTPENAGELLAEKDVDGLLVGGASLDAERFTAIVRA
jgi:triosephosphate isomerase